MTPTKIRSAAYRARKKVRDSDALVRLESLHLALAELTDCFLEKHGCFPLDDKRWNAAMSEAYRLVGQPGTPDRKEKWPRREP